MAIRSPLHKLRCPLCNQERLLSQYPVVSGLDKTKVLRPGAQDGVGKYVVNIFNRSLDGYKQEFAHRQCPNCSYLLPPNIEQVDENITIAVIGDTYSGKSHYIAAMIDQLKGILLPERTIQVLPATQEIEEIYQREYYSTLFELHRPLPRTQQASNPLNEPLIYEVTLGETPNRPAQTINLFIYDASGEDLAQQIALFKFRPHILNAKAIIFLADPWSMPEFVNKLSHDKQPNVTQKTRRRSADVLAWIIKTFKLNNNELAQEGKFPLPTAIVLSKADLIPYLFIFGPHYAFLADPVNQRPPNIRDTAIIDYYLKDLLNHLNEGRLVGRADEFRAAKFFAISATGASVGLSPVNQTPEYENAITPYRCLDPLFWILRELDILD